MHWHEICFWFFSIFQIFFNKNANAKRLSMRRENQNLLIFQPNPESFCRAIIFSRRDDKDQMIRPIDRSSTTCLAQLTAGLFS
jgi:hypothetical protein